VLPCRFGHFLSPKPLAVGAIPANLRALNNNLKAEVGLNLPPQLLQRLAKKLFHFSASETDNMGVLTLHSRLVIVLIATHVHQVELINQPAGLQHFKSAIDGNPIELRIDLLRHFIEALGIQMFPGSVNQLEQNLPLPGESDTSLLE